MVKAYPWSGGEKSSAPAAVWEARRAINSPGEKPTLAKAVKSSSVVLTGWGTIKSGAGTFGCGRPITNSTLGAPGQTERLRAPTNWILYTYISQVLNLKVVSEDTHKSPGVIAAACLKKKGLISPRTSSIPTFPGSWSSVALKIMIDPSAPPPLIFSPRNQRWDKQVSIFKYNYPKVGEIPMASWKERRSAPWAFTVFR